MDIHRIRRIVDKLIRKNDGLNKDEAREMDDELNDIESDMGKEIDDNMADEIRKSNTEREKK